MRLHRRGVRKITRQELTIERRIVSGASPMEMLLVRMVKVKEVEFVMPDKSLLFFNKGGKEYVWEK